MISISLSSLNWVNEFIPNLILDFYQEAELFPTLLYARKLRYMKRESSKALILETFNRSVFTSLKVKKSSRYLCCVL